MNIILFFFVLPLATIILSIVLQKILRNAFLTAVTFFAIYLILAFTAFDESFLVFAIAYTIISYITAVIAEIFFRNRNCCNCRNYCNCRNCLTCMNNTNNDVSTINDNRQNLINSPQVNGNVASNAQNQNNFTNGRPNAIAVNVRDSNNESNNSRWCCYRR